MNCPFLIFSANSIPEIVTTACPRLSTVSWMRNPLCTHLGPLDQDFRGPHTANLIDCTAYRGVFAYTSQPFNSGSFTE